MKIRCHFYADRLLITRTNVIAGILTCQGRKTAYGERFTAHHVGSLRRYHEIPRVEPSTRSPAESCCRLVSCQGSRRGRFYAPSLVNAGLVASEHITPGAPWHIRITEELRNLFVDNAPPDYVPVVDAMRRLGVSRQTLWQRVKSGELEALHVRQGQRKGLVRLPVFVHHQLPSLDVPMRPGPLLPGRTRDLPVPAQSASIRARVFDLAGPQSTLPCVCRCSECCLPHGLRASASRSVKICRVEV